MVTGITVIGHDGERRIPVSPCEDPGCYKREFTYSADLAQLNALTKVSQSCEQFVRVSSLLFTQKLKGITKIVQIYFKLKKNKSCFSLILFTPMFFFKRDYSMNDTLGNCCHFI